MAMTAAALPQFHQSDLQMIRFADERPATLMPRVIARFKTSINNDASDRFAFVHQLEGVVDLVERHGVRDE